MPVDACKAMTMCRLASRASPSPVQAGGDANLCYSFTTKEWQKVPGQQTKKTPLSAVADVIGTYVRFQPRSADFQEALGDVLEQALQASMFTHSTLTEGEWVQIGHEGTMHDVKVLTLQPEAAVSIIGEMSFHQTKPSAKWRNTGTHENNGIGNLTLHLHNSRHI